MALHQLFKGPQISLTCFADGPQEMFIRILSYGFRVKHHLVEDLTTLDTPQVKKVTPAAK